MTPPILVGLVIAALVLNLIVGVLAVIRRRWDLVIRSCVVIVSLSALVAYALLRE